MATPIRAKFKVRSITRVLQSVKTEKGWENKEVNVVEMYVVTDGTEENKRFFASTPTGEIKLGVIFPEAIAGMDLGKEVYVDFTVVD